MMAPLFVVIGIINILANTKNYGISIDNPDTRDIRVRRDIRENDISTKTNDILNNVYDYHKIFKRQLSLYTQKYSNNPGYSTPNYTPKLDWNFATQNNGIVNRNGKDIAVNGSNYYNNWRANYSWSNNNNTTFNNTRFNGYRHNNTGFNGQRYNGTGFNVYRYNNIVNYTTIRNAQNPFIARNNATGCKYGNTYLYNCNYTGFVYNNTGFRYPMYNYNYQTPRYQNGSLVNGFLSRHNTTRFNYGNIYTIHNYTGYRYNNNGNWNPGYINNNTKYNVSQTFIPIYNKSGFGYLNPVYNSNYTGQQPRYNGYGNIEPNIPVYNYQDPTKSSFSGYYGLEKPGQTNYYNATIKPYAPGFLPIPDFNGINNVNTSTQWYNGVNFTLPFGPSVGIEGGNDTVSATTPKILWSCIICNIGCPTGKHRSGIFCVPDDYDGDY